MSREQYPWGAWIVGPMYELGPDGEIFDDGNISVPFPLDLHEGRAFVSLVAFTMRDLAPRRGGRWTSWLLRPIATHEFLNVRTYVRSHAGSAVLNIGL